MRDPYLYSDCDVLKNKMDIKDAPLLDIEEVEYSCNAIHELAHTPLPGDYSFAHLCEMHHYIFQDLYDWAGIPRTVPMEKAEAVLGYMSIEYAQPNEIKKEAEAVLDRMNNREWDNMTISEQAGFLAQDMADLWKVHCFREGNTRTTVTFVCQFADEHNMPIDRGLFENHSAYTRNALVAASAIFKEADFRKTEYLIKIIKDGLERAASQREKLDQPRQRNLSDWKRQISGEREKQQKQDREPSKTQERKNQKLNDR